MYYVYILKSDVFKKSYVGKTDNLERRLKEHNKGKCTFTKKYLPWKILFFEEFKTNTEAVNREKFYKSKLGRIKLKKIFTKIRIDICPIV